MNAISATSTAATSRPQAVHPAQARDADGDNDGSKAKAAAPSTGALPLASAGSLGTQVNEMA
jgi:hypothetical protein